MTKQHPILALLDEIETDIGRADAKLTELARQLGELDLPARTEASCPLCGVKAAGPRTLAEHVYTSHDGPLPAHWVSVDASVTAEGLGARPSGRAKAA